MRSRLLPVRFVVTLSSVCAATVALAPAGAPERAVAAMLLVFLLPGLGLSELVPVAPGIGAAGRALLAVALSVAAVILDSGALYVADVRLGLDSWALSLAGIAIACSAGSLLRRRAPLDAPRVPRIHLHVPLVVATACAAAVLTGTTLLTVSSVAHRARVDHFTQLWALPATAPSREVRIGIYNHEGTSETYRLVVRSDRHVVRTQTVPVALTQSWTTTQLRPKGASDLTISISRIGAGAAVRRSVELRYGAS
jgi:uncharacterized membrane protein